jgi:hypothetical protein
MRYISSLCLLICCIWLSGCQADENLRSANETGLLITLTDESDHAYARTMPSALEKPVADMFHLRVAYSGTDNVAYDDKCTESILLKEGTYDLTATYGENPVIALDAPYYIGKLESQEVVTGQMTSANISCMVGNALLSVIYNESALKKVYDTYFVTVSVGQESVDLDATSGKSAYFQAGSSVSLVFHGQLAGTGQEVSYDIPAQEKFANIPAKTHVKVTLGVDESSVSSGVGISVEKLETETVSVVETLPSEFMPKPKLEAEGFVNNELSFAETEKKTAVIRLKLASPLQDLKLKFHSTDEKFAGLEAEKEYVLSNAEDKAAVETALGITLPDIGTTEGSLDFTSLIPQLMTDNGNTVSSTIEVDVEANNRWASEDEAANRVYILKCNKPIFHVSVYPGNIWTKEFTMNPLIAEEVEAGDYELLSQKMTYQFSMNGETGWTNLGDDLRKADLQPGGTYFVRGVYRDAINSEPVAVTTYPQIELTNGGLEGASISKGEDKNSSKYGAVYNWSGWSTLNELTCDKCTIFIWWGNTAFNSRSGTRPSSSVREGSEGSSSVWIMTMGYGYGGFSGPEKMTPSELFLGTLTDVNHDEDTATKNYGINYKSRPTGLRFFYKYAPYNNDSSDIYIQVKGSGGEILGEAKLNQNQTIATFTEITLNIDYNPQYVHLEPATLVIVFKSGFNSDVKDYGTGDRTGTNSAEPSHRGSELYIDDISLVYDK